MNVQTVGGLLLLITVGVQATADTESNDIINSVGMRFSLIPPGDFLMGSGEAPEAIFKAFPQYEHMPDSFSDELPQHRIRITRPFFLAKHETTNSQFRQFVEATGYKTGAEREDKGPRGPGGWAFNQEQQKFAGRRPEFNWRNPGFAVPDLQPVVNVSWHDAVAFCEWLGKREQKTYRLPTEAEWEYAARAGTTTRYWSGDDPESLARIANTADAAFFGAFPAYYERAKTLSANDGFKLPAPVGSFPPNAFGLHDVHGNVWEWTSDWYGEDYYANSLTDDPQGPANGGEKVRRGGAWHTAPLYSRATYRNYNTPDSRYPNLGFRVLREAK